MQIRSGQTWLALLVTTFSYQAIGTLTGAGSSPVWTLAAQSSNGRTNGSSDSDDDEEIDEEQANTS